MLLFNPGEVKTYVKTLVPVLQDMDSTKFDNHFDIFGKISLAEIINEKIAAAELWLKKTTLTEVTAPTCGTEKIATTVGDVYTVALITGALKISDDNILIYKAASAEFVNCPRMTLDEIVLTGVDAIDCAFFETRGRVNIYLKDGVFTVDPDFHYNYYVDIDWPASDVTDFADLETADFVTLATKIATYFRTILIS